MSAQKGSWKCKECGHYGKKHMKYCMYCGTVRGQTKRPVSSELHTGIVTMNPMSMSMFYALERELKVTGELSADTLLRYALRRVGWDPSASEETQKTPARFIKYLLEYLNPFEPARILGDGFKGPANHGIHGLIAQCNIPFRMICEHHLLPAFGLAHVGYIPRQKVVGLSKLARLVDGAGTHRPSMQELIGEKIADALMSCLDANGAVVMIEAEHTCMACRGVNAPGVITSTQVIRGVFRDVPAAREEFMALVASAKGKGSNR